MQHDEVVRNKVVTLTYVLRNSDGHIFEYNDLPIEYLHGSGSELFAKIERSLEGHRVGDQVNVELTPEEGFGPHEPGLAFTDDVENVPAEYRHIGAQVEAQNAKGEAMTFVVTRIEDGKLTVDANHPLAGQTVKFEVRIHGVRDATPEELRRGRPAGGPPSTIQ
ncbi:MAG: FKBP-type peptidyl-prolyl cis-trans isomerase [Acidiferrobacterales bacterium]